MKDLQTILGTLTPELHSGKLLPTAQLVETFYAACPLDADGLHKLALTLDACTEQIYEYYRPLSDLFRKEILRVKPHSETVRMGLALGLLDDEEWRAE